VDVRVTEGDRIKQDNVLLLLDAMKMHNEIISTIPGSILQVHVRPGDTVQKDQLLITLKAD